MMIGTRLIDIDRFIDGRCYIDTQIYDRQKDNK